MASSKRSSTRRLATLVLAVVFAACACGTDPVDELSSDWVTGVVSQVTGAGAIESFVVVDDEGASHAFRPAEGLTYDGEPIERLRDHLVDRDRISIRYEVVDDGPPIAVEITRRGG